MKSNIGNIERTCYIQVISSTFPPYRAVEGVTGKTFVHTVEPDETPKTRRVRGVIDVSAFENARFVVLDRFPGARRVPSSHSMFNETTLLAAWRVGGGLVKIVDEQGA